MKKKYPYELKKQVVELFFEGESAADLTEKFEISNSRRIYDWTKIVREHGYKGLEYGVSRISNDSKEDVSLAVENNRLRLENEYLKKLLDLKRG